MTTAQHGTLYYTYVNTTCSTQYSPYAVNDDVRVPVLAAWQRSSDRVLPRCDSTHSAQRTDYPAFWTTTDNDIRALSWWAGTNITTEIIITNTIENCSTNYVERISQVIDWCNIYAHKCIKITHPASACMYSYAFVHNKFNELFRHAIGWVVDAEQNTKIWNNNTNFSTVLSSTEIKVKACLKRRQPAYV